MNTITLLIGDKKSGKGFPKQKPDFPYLHDYKICPLNSLEDIKEIIVKHRNNPYAYFIRGIPHTFQDDGSFRRKKKNAEDSPLNWIMIDIDGWEKDGKTLKEKLIEYLPFVNQETGMLIDYSSSEGVFGCGEDYRSKYYAHVYLWCNKAFTSQDWKDRLKGLPIDTAVLNVVHAHYFTEPTLLEGYQTELKERTIFIDGEYVSYDFPLPQLSTKEYQTTAHKGVKAISLEEAYEDIFRPNPKTGKVVRHFGLYRFFCKVVAKGSDQEYWQKKYWNDYRRSKASHDTLSKVNKSMLDAKEFVYGKFKNDFEPQFRVREIEEENLKEYIDYKVGTNYLIKSGQMTWKTQSLKNIPKTIIENGVERPTKIWVIGHRVNLIRQMCEELELKIYCDLPEFIEEKIEDRTFKQPYPFWKEDRLGITFDSLWRTFDDGKATEVDWLVIDESEQVFIELLTTTRTMERSYPFENKKLQPTSKLRSNIGRAIQASKSVIALDADLGNLSQWFITDWKSDNFLILHNKYQSLKGRTMNLLPTPDYTLEKIIKEIQDGKRVYINCDTKKKAQLIHGELEALFDPSSQRNGKRAKGIVIHGNNSSSPENKDIARFPNEKIPELVINGLRWLITTPTFETGLSIGTNETWHYRFHSAYALWNWFNYTANTLRQAICRVRNADNYYVYIPSKFGKPTDISKLLDSVEEMKKNPRNLDRTEELKRYVEQQKANSQANKVLHFQLLMEEIGVALERVEKDSAKGSQMWNQAMIALNNAQKEQILQATDVKDEEEYKKLGFTEADQYRRWKYEAQQAFDTREITTELISRWDFGRIEHRWNIRQLLQRKYEALEKEEQRKLLCDSKQRPFVHEALTRVFNDFGIKPEEHKQTNKVCLLTTKHISQENKDWLCYENILNALQYILQWHGFSVSDIKNLQAEPLRLYKKLAYLACYGVTHFGKYDGRLIKGKALKKDDLIEDYKKRRIYKEIPDKKRELNRVTEKILEERITARSEDLSETEINYYRYRNPHLVLKDYQPKYSQYFGKNLSDSNSHIEKYKSGKKIQQKEAVLGV